MGYSAQNEKGKTAQNGMAPCGTETAKPDGEAIKPRKSSSIPVFRVLFQFGSAFLKPLAKPLWKPRVKEETDDLMGFHLDAF